MPQLAAWAWLSGIQSSPVSYARIRVLITSSFSRIFAYVTSSFSRI
jgi:hypothetical protein